MLDKPFLKSLISKSHPLKPVVTIGPQGLKPTIHNEIEAALLAHELIKIRIHGQDRAEKRALISHIADVHQAHVVQTIGHILVLYKTAPKPPVKSH